MPPRFNFVDESHPASPASARSRRSAAHSHAIREAHARKRHLRTHAYLHSSNEGGGTRCLSSDNEVIVRFQVDVSPGPLNLDSVGGFDPFSTFPRSLSRDERFLLDYYVKIVVPAFIAHCAIFSYPGNHQDQILREWVGLATDDVNLLNAILLGACRHISLNEPNGQIFTPIALQYKSQCIRALRHRIQEEPESFDIITTAYTMALAMDDLALEDIPTSRQHVNGLQILAQIQGGPRRLGLTGLLETIYWRLLSGSLEGSPKTTC